MYQFIHYIVETGHKIIIGRKLFKQKYTLLINQHQFLTNSITFEQTKKRF